MAGAQQNPAELKYEACAAGEKTGDLVRCPGYRTTDPDAQPEPDSPDKNAGGLNAGCMVDGRGGFCTKVETCQRQKKEPLKGEKGPDGKWPCDLRGKDVQCCVEPQKGAPPPAPTPGGCTVNNQKGVCMDKNTCQDQKKEPLAGQKGPDGKWPCEGGANIQCCVGDGKTPSLKPCTVNNRNGVCKEATACGGENKEPLFGQKDADGNFPCAGGNGIQCCVDKQKR